MDEHTNDPVFRLSLFWHIIMKKSIITKSFSKSFAMTGYRIGYAVADTIHHRQNVKVTGT